LQGGLRILANLTTFAANRDEENWFNLYLTTSSALGADDRWAPFAWKREALRHSFLSYRVADIQNMAQVALEAGNSPQIIFKHYRELVRPKAAKAWFGLMPAGKN
jgi:hypothetical protein